MAATVEAAAMVAAAVGAAATAAAADTAAAAAVGEGAATAVIETAGPERLFWAEVRCIGRKLAPVRPTMLEPVVWL